MSQLFSLFLLFYLLQSFSDKYCLLIVSRHLLRNQILYSLRFKLSRMSKTPKSLSKNQTTGSDWISYPSLSLSEGPGKEILIGLAEGLTHLRHLG